MQLLAQYPVSADICDNYKGRPVMAMLVNGEMVCGVIDRIHDGHLVMRPVNNVPTAAISSLKKSMKESKGLEKVRTKAYNGYDGTPYNVGYGYGNYGWGAGWWWILPLFVLTALVAFPFFW
ncbi:hypothetical protein [Paenibacillus sp.]|jgi:hypothetical protein|uniref:hypothetical protein n=1 Tax=Paenibacillus sp. TaxID=58172 RepID=UPI002828AA77|nr:hypothetical protein [Paenibacillus sp.]MDR0268064.1 hypothetical protein [Paenibacillus sp.]